MIGLLIAIHIIVCIFMILIVLLQTGKGAEIGAAFGGSSQTLFGPRGAGTLLSKITVIAAIIFMVTSISLSYLRGIRLTSGASERRTLPIEREVTPPPIPDSPAPIPNSGGQTN